MIHYTIDLANAETVRDHLWRCSDDFIPPLTARVDIGNYADKIVECGCQVEAWNNDLLVGLVAYYLNTDFAYVTNVSVLRSWRGRGIARRLMQIAIEEVSRSVGRMILEIDRNNLPAIQLYKSFGFVQEGECRMKLDLKKPFDAMTRDTPSAKYAYDFDFEVMHPMMIETFEPWFIDGLCLELGSFEGAFTKRLIDHFDNVTCIEASTKAQEEMQKRMLGIPGIMVYSSTFEEVKLSAQYDNIFMTHVLEHVEDPVRILKRINDEWLAPGGRLLTACPNANAASRQIAVRMGKIHANSWVTPDEQRHGHKRTYSLDALESDARESGLKVIHRGGIFFKALANFQLDLAKSSGIIDDEYLRGCYVLGQQYPDLCASIYLVCEKGEK